MHSIITLTWDSAPVVDSVIHAADTSIRQMTHEDLFDVFRIDNLAFDPLWQHSLAMIRLAFDQASIATVAENKDGLVGYQITTRTQYGSHLGRLAVLPGAQQKGIGLALVNDLQQKIHNTDQGRLTVNTHEINHRSIGLYNKAGFSQTRESYPVYRLKI
jgi:ribosomal protein S18 acetylase RimI-like enzyme